METRKESERKRKGAGTASTRRSAGDAPKAQAEEQAQRQAEEQTHGTGLAPANGDFLVVGVGASAGGVPALEAFFDGLGEDKPGIAFVVVVHLSPDHESNLAAVLQNHTTMRVLQVNEPVKLAPNHIYVIPPGKYLTVSDEQIVLTEPDELRSKRAPIDLLFRTLAESHGSAAAAVVLSGTGSDGTIGLPAIKELGGITLAQDPSEAEHDQMPKSAIATGFVDYVLPVAQMAERLLIYRDNRQSIVLHVPDGDGEEDGQDGQAAAEAQAVATTGGKAGAHADTDRLYEIIALLHARTGHNFGSYKRSTLARRVERRMQVNDLPDLAGYLAFLRSHPNEMLSLMRDLLISVTSFFRDATVWGAVEHSVIPNLFRGKDRADSTVRVWVAGCATGEEAYSVAMLLHEHASHLQQPPHIQVFATDLDENAIARARDGSYPETIALDVSPERLRRFFVHTGRRYRVAKELRDSVLFAVHNLLKDPPFSKIDLITCRNLLIYLNRDAQSQLLSLFHFALRPESYLLLGTSESAEGVSHLFAALDKKHHIFTRRPVPRFMQQIPELHAGSVRAAGVGTPRPPLTSPAERTTASADMHQDLLERYALPSVVVDESYEIVHLSEHAGRYMQLGGGEPTHNLLRTVHPDLRFELRSALYRVAQTGTSSQTRRVRMRLDGVDKFVRLLVRPVREPEDLHGYTLVLFDEVDEVAEAEVGLVQGGDGEEAGTPFARQLEEEVQVLKAQLRSTIEQYETSVEELKASNEELQAMNEELRSATEELETSREEMQATNEELMTVNQELRLSVDEVSRANSDLLNFMVSSDVATIFLNRQMQVKRYTPKIERLFNVIPTDVNRPIAHLTHKLHYEDLVSDAQSVLNELRPIEREVQTAEGEWYIVRLLPYRTVEDKIDGVVITFTDITQRKRDEEALRESEGTMQAIANLVPDLLWSSGPDGYTDWYNQRWLDYIGQKLEQALGSGWTEAIHPDDREASARSYSEALERGRPVRQEHRIRRHDGEYRWFVVQAEPLRDEAGEIVRWYCAATDVHEERVARDRLEERVRERTAELAQANEALRRLSARILDVQEEERRHIARELHDQIGQYLTGLRFMLGRISTGSDREVRGELEATEEVLTDLIERVRELALDLRPSMLDDMGLLAALGWLVERYQAQTGIQVEFRHKGLKKRLSTGVETTVYRVVQEALTNVARHSGAERVTVQVVVDGNVNVVVKDDGKGFDLASTLNKHTSTGISSMRERVELAGGVFSIESSPGHGTTVMAEVLVEGKREGQEE